MTTTEIIEVDQEFVTVDLLLWRRFRSELKGRVERTIDINRGLCASLYLPVGAKVLIEIPDVDSGRRVTVRLWS